MKIKKGDTVIVISGADKGTTGKVLHVYPELGRVMVEGVNVRKKHQRSRRGDQKGQVIDKPLPVHVSNVQIVDPKKGGPSRIKISRESGKAVRIAKKSGAVI
jgi:large subunit ribosomal protein L24